MSIGVDNKVVSIKFDNAQFEAKVAETLSSIQRLNQGLNFAAGQRGLGDLDKAAKNVDLNHLGTSVDGVSAKFLALSAVALTALVNITNRAIDTGISITKSLTLDGVMDGFKEYELNMNSIQTILANTSHKGENLQTVSAALDELNEYADLTIYNFAEMTRNIGTFTAAGVDLDTSVSAIKGFSNVAATAGAGATQTAGAMYQLSQAMSSGVVKLQDWMSLEKAGLSTEVFRNSIMETAKVHGVNVDEMVEKNGSFRASLSEGWLTAEIMNETLSKFTGDLTDAQLKQMGYTDEQIVGIQEMAATAIDAATKVKTFTQLIDTTKEVIGTGWAESFKIIFGDFEEAKTLFTSIYGYIEGVVNRSSDARNTMLTTWKDFGARDTMINALKTAFQGILTILNPIKEAFRDIFPKKTGEDLILLTARFSEFAKKIAVSSETAAKIKSVFSGLFSIFKIGFAVIKGVVSVFGEILRAISPAGSGLLSFGANIGDVITRYQEFLVEGGAIERFFDNLKSYIQPAVDGIKNFVGTIKDLVKNTSISVPTLDDFGSKFGRIGDRVKPIIEMLGRIFNWLADRVESLGGVFERVLTFVRPKLAKIKEVIGSFVSDITSAFDKGDFNAITDLINIGLIGGILLAIRRIKSIFGDLNVNIGGGVLDSIRGAFGQLTTTLGALQAQLKADALMKIGIAIGVLTASVLILSLIDSEALTKALTAIAVGFGQLIGAMALMTKVDATGIKMAGIAIGLGLLAGAVLILSAAVRMLSGLDWEELKTGLTGVAALLGGLAAATHLMSTNVGGMIRAGIAMLPIAIALNILAGAVKLFSMMAWDELGRGLAGVGGGLAILVAGMSLMPGGMIVRGVGILAVAVALNVLALAVKQFSMMEWGEMGRGLAGIAGGLLAIAAGMQLMPLSMALTGPALLIVAVALNVMAAAVKLFSMMDMDELTRGIGSIAAMLLILSVATNSMTGAIVGAAAIVLVAGALKVLADVMVVMADLSLGQIGGALLGIAGVLTVLGLAAAGAIYVLPGLIAIALALPLIGAGFALMGAGALMAAKAFEIITNTGEAGIEVFKNMLTALIDVLPAIGAAIALMLLNLAKNIIDGLPPILKSLRLVLESLLEELTELLPELGDFISTLISEIIDIVDENLPNLIETGFKILDALLTGLDENIEEITERVSNIIEQFLGVLEERMPDIVTAGVKVLVAFLSALTDKIDLIVTAVAGLIIAFLDAVTAEIPNIQTAAADLIIAFITGLGAKTLEIVAAGTAVLLQVIWGIAASISQVTAAATAVITEFITQMGAMATQIAGAGAKALAEFLKGISNNISTVVTAASKMIVTFITQIGAMASQIVTAGANAIIKFVEGVASNVSRVITAGVKIALELAGAIADQALAFANAAADILIDFLNGLADAIRSKSGELRAAGRNIASAIIEGMTGGLFSKAREVANAAIDVATGAVNAVKGVLGMNSPSKVFIDIGGNMAAGFAIGMNSDTSAQRSAARLADRTVEAFQGTLKNMNVKMEGFEDINPVIAPVLDLSGVESEAGRLAAMMAISPITPDVSFDQARYIAHTADRSGDDSSSDDSYDGPREVKFEQNNYSPRPLSTADVYRNTRSQIAMAREELGLE